MGSDWSRGYAHGKWRRKMGTIDPFVPASHDRVFPLGVPGRRLRASAPIEDRLCAGLTGNQRGDDET